MELVPLENDADSYFESASDGLPDDVLTLVAQVTSGVRVNRGEVCGTTASYYVGQHLWHLHPGGAGEQLANDSRGREVQRFFN